MLTPLLTLSPKKGSTTAPIPLSGSEVNNVRPHVPVRPKQEADELQGALQEGNTLAPIPSSGSAGNSVLLQKTVGVQREADELQGVVKRRRLRRAQKRELRVAFSETDAETLERPDGTNCIISDDTLERPDGTNCRCIESHLNVSANDGMSVQVDIEELDIPSDFIIDRPSIMKYGRLQFDAKLSLVGLRDSNTVIRPELRNQAPPIVPATESEVDTKPKLGSQTPEDVAVEELNVALERF